MANVSQLNVNGTDYNIVDSTSGYVTENHSHGNITSSGDCTTNATIASGDRLMINDESASKIKNSSITFGSSTTSFLANDGTWVTPTIPTITYGTSDPSGGSNGDIYIKYEA